ncbi:MAG TPA: hypothetical protein DDX89_00565 [Candidatus Omnitrophica bacterium]|nr:hypothetical protein [Candidatus Omnitrophota bacterium]HBQ37991.1 hypothetical protein [Candidatus Omnitrophota bacterium]
MEILQRAMTQPSALVEAKTPFRFYTSFVLQKATGLRAATLPQLVALLRKVPDGCIYYHTHYFLLTHHYLTPEPPNDFAYWVTGVLGEERLGELLAGIDIMEHSALQSLREALVGTIEDYLSSTPTATLRFASEGEEFFFVKSVRIVMPTSHEASTLVEFAEALSRVSIHSLYFHVFDARLRVGRPTNDFAIWLDEHLGLKDLAEHVANLDPYAHTLETLRSLVLSLVKQELDRQGTTHAKPG